MIKKGIKSIPYLQLLTFIAVTTVFTVFSLDHIFFWDTVQLGSRHAHWFYDTNFSNILLPNDLDSGHPPLFGIYLAFLWKLFGKSLIVSHLAMLPFLLGILIQSFLLAKYFLGVKYAWTFPLILLANPCYLGHSILISPDIVLLFFFLLSFYSILKNRKILTYEMELK